MNSFFVVGVLSVCLLWCCCNADKIPPQFEINLDLPPRQRWKNAYEKMYGDAYLANEMKVYSRNIKKVLSDTGCDDKCIMRLNAAYKMRYPDYYEELVGISEFVKVLNFTLEEIVAAQYRYELAIMQLDPTVGEYDLPVEGMGCTSVLTCNSDNVVLHGRNLDWSDSKHFAQTMFRINATRNGKLIFQSDQLIGNVGVLTGVRPGGFSMSINARRKAPYPTLEQFLSCVETVPLQPILTGFRYYIENFETYDDLFKNITNHPSCAPRYSIIGGVGGKGARLQHILSDDYPSYQVNILKEELECNDNSWFVAQCNSDFDVVPSPTVDERRYAVMTELNKEQRSHASTGVGLFHAMTIEKVKNVKTVHTSIMCPVNGSIVTVAYDI